MGRVLFKTLKAKHVAFLLLIIINFSTVLFLGRWNSGAIDTFRSDVTNPSSDVEATAMRGARAKSRPTSPLISLKSTRVQVSRLFESQNACIGSKPGTASRIIVDNNKTIANCIVPKAGCTFWINIFRFINNETAGNVYESPLHIPRWFTHYANKGPEYSMRHTDTNTNSRNNESKSTRPDFLKSAFRFMFVREPYRRLWGTWIDKFLLPDFWFEAGKTIAQVVGLSKDAQRCPVNITFAHLLTFITHDYFKRYPQDLNEHWAPFHLICDPCIFRPHFIGKMESFQEDTDFVLTANNLGWVREKMLQTEFDPADEWWVDDESIANTITNFSYPKNSPYPNPSTTTSPEERALLKLKVKANYRLDHRDRHILHEIEKQLMYTLRGVVGEHIEEVNSCTSVEFVAQRLWQSFQYNGYIPNYYSFQMKSVKENGWRKLILHAYYTWPTKAGLRHDAQRIQNKMAFQSAYQNVTLGVMAKIQDMFMRDFQQFGYDPQPKSLFRQE